MAFAFAGGLISVGMITKICAIGFPLIVALHMLIECYTDCACIALNPSSCSNTTAATTHRNRRHSAYEVDNVFIQTLQAVHSESYMRNESCWICGYAPHSQQYGYPFIGITWTAQMLADMIKNNQTMITDFRRAPEARAEMERTKVHLAYAITSGAFAFVNHDNRTNIPDVNATLVFDYNVPLWLPRMGDDPVCPHTDKEREQLANCVGIFCWYLITTLVQRCTPIEAVQLVLTQYIRTTYLESYVISPHIEPEENVNVTIIRWAKAASKYLLVPNVTSLYLQHQKANPGLVLTLPEGVYYLCDKWAYKTIPVHLKKPCFIGQIMPAFTVSKTLPKTHIRIPKPKRKRALTVKSSTTEMFFLSLMPAFGVARLYVKLNLIATEVDAAFNATRGAIQLISSEQEQIRLVTLQNRMALDYLLAADGGVCARIGSSCCSWIPDNSGAIHHELDNLEEVQSHIREKAQGLFDGWDWSLGIGSWLGSMGESILAGLLVVLVMIFSIYLIYKLIGCLFDRCTQQQNGKGELIRFI
uniref:Uncharacterized protein n=1 Tax=Leptobrachium leishanense TaxID=445787 RepID=A0A8C5PDU7_9ANUR